MKLRSEHTEDTASLRKRRNAPPLLPGDVAGQGLSEGMAGAEEPHFQQHDLLMQQHVAASGAVEEFVRIPMSELMAQEDPPGDAPDGGRDEDVEVG